MLLSKKLNNNISHFENAFRGCGDIVSRKIPVGASRQLETYITYIDGLVDRSYIERQLITNIVVMLRDESISPHFGDIKNALINSGAATADLSEQTDLDELFISMLSGDCVFLIDGSDTGIVLSSKGWASRGINQPDTEKAMQGPKEAFTESMRTNTALVRRRIRDTKLKTKQMRVGRRSQTDISVLYLEDVVKNSILSNIIERLEKIDIDAVLDSGYIEQLIEESNLTPFPQTQATERPDKAAAAILEGRVAIIVDNSPFAILLPTTLNMLFQASEDYYQRFGIMSSVRILRYAAVFIAMSLSALYLCTTVYHPQMIPPQLALKMAAARLSVPFPAVVEILIMEGAFELLREAGIRLPGSIGGTLGIVGGLIMGQAAVEAGLVSPIVVIVVALSGIASFLAPHQSLAAGIRIVKVLLIALSALFGLAGFFAAVMIVLVHLASINNFGIPYLYPLGCSDINTTGDMKDVFIRAPLDRMKNRPFFANPKERVRMR
jgi:spore germination protein